MHPPPRPVPDRAELEVLSTRSVPEPLARGPSIVIRPPSILNSLRLLLLNYEYPPLGGGAATATRALARELARLGHEVRVVTSRFGDLPAREETEGFVIDRIPVRRRRAEQCTPFEMLTFIGSGCWRAGELARWKPDGALAFFGIPGGPVGWWLRRRHGVPYVVALRGGDVPGHQPETAGYHRLVAPVLRRIWRDAHAVVANSRGLAEVARQTTPELEFPVIPNGVDCDVFRPAAAGGRSAGQPGGTGEVRLLFVGRLSPEKGLDELFQALAPLAKGGALGGETGAWKLDLVGEGPERARLEGVARALGIAGQVQWRGWVKKSEVAGVYQNVDLFVFPSRGEGMPNSVLEAMASGLPVIGCRVRGVEDVVVDGETGALVRSGDIEGLSAALRRAITDADWRTAQGRGARRRAESFSWSAAALKFAELLGEAAGARSGLR